MGIQKYKKGEVIIKQGTYDTSAYIVRSGKVEVSSIINEKKTVLGVLGEKKIFGEMGLIEDKSRSATATAIEDTIVTMISRNDFNTLIEKNPKVLLPIIQSLFERLRTANKTFVIKTDEESKNKETDKVEYLLLSGLNETSEKALHENTIKINKFPYKAGRKQEDVKDDVLSDNDLYLEDTSKEPPFNISSNHFLIEKVEDKYAIVDRGSNQGTIVNGIRIKEKCVLDRDVNSIVVGSARSPFVFKLEIKRGSD